MILSFLHDEVSILFHGEISLNLMTLLCNSAIFFDIFKYL